MRAKNFLRPVVAFLAVAGSATTISLTAGSAAASAPTPDTVTTTAPTVPATMTVSQGPITLTGASVNDTTTPSATVLATLSATSGTLTIPSSHQTGLTVNTGYSFSAGTISFTGTSAAINTALGYLTYTAPASAAGVTITVAATGLSQEVSGGSVAYDPQDQHYFEYVPNGTAYTNGIPWSAAQAASNTLSFDGEEGYLATIPSSQVNGFIQAHVTTHNVWSGGESFDAPTQSGASSYPQTFTNAKLGTGDTAAPGRVWIWADDEKQFTSAYPTGEAFDSTYYGGPQAGQVITECTAVSGACKFTNEDQWGGTENDPLGWVDGDGASGNTGAWDNATYNLGTSGDGEPNQTNFAPGTTDGVNNGEHYLELNAATSMDWNDLEDTSATSGNYELAGYVAEFGDQIVGASSSTGGTSATSNSIAVGGAPSTPTNVGATVGSSSGTATITWTAPTAGAPFTGYTVTATPLQGGATVTQTCTGSPCTVGGLAPGTTYSVTVQASNSSGQSSPASPSTNVVIPNVPGAPTNVVATPSTTTAGQATVNFSAPASNGGAPITSYTVTATPAGGGTAITKTCTGSPCTITGLSNGTSYTVTVVATNEEGTSVPSTSASATTATVPGPPTGLSVNAVSSTGGKAVVSFTAPSSNGGSPITGYTIKATPAGGGPVVTASCTSSPCTVSGLTNGTNYTFTVTTQNAIGSSTPAGVAGTVLEVQTPVITSGGGTVQAGASGANGPTVTGTGVPGNTITVFLNGTPEGTTVVNSDGTWTFKLPGALTAGVYKVTSVASLNGVTTGISNQSTLTVESVLPPPVFVSTPAKNISVDSASFVISEASADATLQCSIDGAAYKACTTSFGLAGLTNGTHTLTVRAIDPTGLLSAPTTYSWTVTGSPDTGTVASARDSVVILLESTKSTASTHGLQVACGSNGAWLRSCRVRAFYKGKIVGTVNRVIHRRLTYVTAQIKPNKRGRRLLRLSGHKGFKLSIKAMIQTRDNKARTAKVPTREYKPFAPTLFTVKFTKNSAKISKKTQKSIRKQLVRLNNVRKMECHVPTYRATVHNPKHPLAARRAKAVCKYMRSLGVSVKGTYVSSTRLKGHAVKKLKVRNRASNSVIASVTYWDLPHGKK